MHDISLMSLSSDTAMPVPNKLGDDTFKLTSQKPTHFTPTYNPWGDQSKNLTSLWQQLFKCQCCFFTVSFSGC